MEKIIRFKTIGSTHDYAKKNAEKYPHGTVIIAGRQTAGRGRFDRKWHSPAGGLYFSAIFEPGGMKPRDVQLLTFAMALSIASAVEKNTGICPRLKWPNDVVVRVKRDAGSGKPAAGFAPAEQNSAWNGNNWKKIAGILTESSIMNGVLGRIVISAGINLNNRIPRPLAGIAVSASGLAGKKFGSGKILGDILKNFKKYHVSFSSWRILKEYKKKSMLAGKKIGLASGGEKYFGTVKGFDGSGAIILALEGGAAKTFHGGEVTLSAVQGI